MPFQFYYQGADKLFPRLPQEMFWAACEGTGRETWQPCAAPQGWRAAVFLEKLSPTGCCCRAQHLHSPRGKRETQSSTSCITLPSCTVLCLGAGFFFFFVRQSTQPSWVCFSWSHSDLVICLKHSMINSIKARVSPVLPPEYSLLKTRNKAKDTVDFKLSLNDSKWWKKVTESWTEILPWVIITIRPYGLPK